MIQNIRKRRLAVWAGRFLASAGLVLLGMGSLDLALQAQGTGGQPTDGITGCPSTATKNSMGNWTISPCNVGICSFNPSLDCSKQIVTISGKSFFFCGCAGHQPPACCHLHVAVDGSTVNKQGSRMFCPTLGKDCNLDKTATTARTVCTTTI